VKCLIYKNLQLTKCLHLPPNFADVDCDLIGLLANSPPDDLPQIVDLRDWEKLYLKVRSFRLNRASHATHFAVCTRHVATEGAVAPNPNSLAPRPVPCVHVTSHIIRSTL